MLIQGQILEGKYRIGRLLGRGGMGSVFEAENTRIKRTVAIKVLNLGADEENTRRFEREAEAAGRIGSDHIVEVLDFGTTPDGERFMVMEYMSGEALKERLKDKPPATPAQIVPLIAQALEGLAAAHDAGIIHRDLKPDNIYILREKAGRKDFVKILDFGISKFSTISSESGQATRTGTVMGTPFYMSPEQAKSANEVDARSDLYSMGVVMYEAVTGVRPFVGATFTELIFKIAFDDPAHPCSVVPSLDRAFGDLILKAMARDSADRFQSAREMKAVLESYLAGGGFQPSATPGPRQHRTDIMPHAIPGAQAAAIALGGGTQLVQPAGQRPEASGPAPAAAAPSSTPGVAPLSSNTLSNTVGQNPQPNAPPSLDTWSGVSAAPAVTATPAPAKKSSAPIIVGAAILAVGLLGAAAIVVSRPSTPAKEGSTATPTTTAEATAQPTTQSSQKAAEPTKTTATATEQAATSVAQATASASGAASTKLTTTAGLATRPGTNTTSTSTPNTNTSTTGKTPPTSNTVSDLGY